VAGCFDLLDQFRADFKNLFAREGRWFLYKIDRTGVEGCQSSFSSLIGDAHDYDRHRPPLHLFAHKPDAIQLRHDEIAGDYIGIQLFDQIECFATVTGRTHNFDKRAPRENLSHHLPHVSGIVDHHYS
jgi:hypothetical protein